MERRKSGRTEVTADVVVSVGEKDVRTQICNISAEGALLRVDPHDAGMLNNEDLAETVRFEFDLSLIHI